VSADHGAGVNEWVNVVRRARLHATTKLVALLVATYADPDGTSIYPGVARLAIQSSHGYRTVQRELARLRAMGLIEQLPRTGVRRGWSTPYRLILASDLLDKLDLPTPAAEDLAVDNLARRYRGRHRAPKSARQPDGAQIDDCTPPGDTTARHDQLADQEKAHRTLHVPPPGFNPPSDETDLRNGGQGSWGHQAGDGIDDEEARRKQQLDRLAEWRRQNPEHEPAAS
jgi:hypothetical protein